MKSSPTVIFDGGGVNVEMRNSFLVNPPSGSYDECYARSLEKKTNTGMICRSLSDCDMLACQTALDPRNQKLDRIRVLKQALKMDV
ncbi:hypothetical protein QQ056_08195 [Oscillatoria laete-virens NRMC-F 0139]|nr:hypothetical protein [Oscillatoria laete-virens NRMC-F 0139]